MALHNRGEEQHGPLALGPIGLQNICTASASVGPTSLILHLLDDAMLRISIDASEGNAVTLRLEGQIAGVGESV
jgi:hypothetical protein